MYPLCNKISDEDEFEVSQCLKGGHSISAWYDGDSFDEDLNIWMDKTGHSNNGYVVDDVTGSLFVYKNNFDSTEHYWINNKSVIEGNVAASILFDIELNPENYTVFNLCKYVPSGISKSRILETTIDDVFFGFDADVQTNHSTDSSIGRSGVGYSRYWLTEQNDKFGSEWVFSTQQHDSYRGNFMDFTLDTFTDQNLLEYGNKLQINNRSSWSCGEIIVSNDKLDFDEILCIENYLQTKYDYTAPIPS